jgi:hypothetical protein
VGNPPARATIRPGPTGPPPPSRSSSSPVVPSHLGQGEAELARLAGGTSEAFNDKRPEEAVAKYVGPRYIQHNPLAPGGPEAFIQFVKAYSGQFPDLSNDHPMFSKQSQSSPERKLDDPARSNRPNRGLSRLWP